MATKLCDCVASPRVGASLSPLFNVCFGPHPVAESVVLVVERLLGFRGAVARVLSVAALPGRSRQ